MLLQPLLPQALAHPSSDIDSELSELALVAFGLLGSPQEPIILGHAETTAILEAVTMLAGFDAAGSALVDASALEVAPFAPLHARRPFACTSLFRLTCHLHPLM